MEIKNHTRWVYKQITKVFAEDTCFVVLTELTEELEKGAASELTNEHKRVLYAQLLERNYSLKESKLHLEMARFFGLVIARMTV